MGVHSGKFGVVDGVDTVRNWSIEELATLPKYVASNTQGGSGRRKGIREWTGSYQKYGGVPLHMPGESFTFTGFTAPGDDVSANGEQYEGTAFVGSVEITWDFAAGAIISHTVNFAGHLALVNSQVAPLSDSAVPDVPIPCDGKAATFDGTTETDIDNVRTITLTLSAENQEYVNSSTVVGGVCWKGRKGGVIDWTAGIEIEDDVRLAELALNAQAWLRFYIDGTDFWDLKWGRVQNYSGLSVDREGGSIISQTINLAMDGFDDSSGAVGQITLPGAVGNYWP